MDPRHPGRPIADVPAELVALRVASPIHAVLTFRGPAIAAHGRPGQFVHLRVSLAGTSPLLRRPFSLLGVNRAHGTFQLLVRTIGRGTELLTSLLPGTTLPALGPLGQGFPAIAPSREVTLVAGGVGVAPLLFYAAERRGGAAAAVYGAGTADWLVLQDELGERAAHLALATDDGSSGHHGPVTDLLPAALEGRDDAVVLACGPRPMMAAAAATCRERGIECYVSFEAWLGCGIGACLGCVIPAAGDEPHYLRVCRDGPVFRAEEVGWSRLR